VVHARHGELTDENPHPHTDCEGSVGVVHNGIIENYERLRDKLEGRGHEFVSETDTEVVPHLVEDADGSLVERVRGATDHLEGSYAVGCVSSDGDEDEIVVARQDSPLAVGRGEGRTSLRAT